jgi:hypothetical protein
VVKRKRAVVQEDERGFVSYLGREGGKVGGGDGDYDDGVVRGNRDVYAEDACEEGGYAVDEGDEGDDGGVGGVGGVVGGDECRQLSDLVQRCGLCCSEFCGCCGGL